MVSGFDDVNSSLPFATFRQPYYYCYCPALPSPDKPQAGAEKVNVRVTVIIGVSRIAFVM